jgi:hypothetical protein
MVATLKISFRPEPPTLCHELQNWRLSYAVSSRRETMQYISLYTYNDASKSIFTYGYLKVVYSTVHFGSDWFKFINDKMFVLKWRSVILCEELIRRTVCCFMTSETVRGIT